MNYYLIKDKCTHKYVRKLSKVRYSEKDYWYYVSVNPKAFLSTDVERIENKEDFEFIPFEYKVDPGKKATTKICKKLTSARLSLRGCRTKSVISNADWFRIIKSGCIWTKVPGGGFIKERIKTITFGPDGKLESILTSYYGKFDLEEYGAIWAGTKNNIVRCYYD